jgi:5-methylcytosine-specific restriction endonuclease McrA
MRDMFSSRDTSAYKRFWVKQRAKVLERDGCRCLVCRTTEALGVHHKYPWHIFRDDSLVNLVTVCRGCHDEIEQLDQIAIYLSWYQARARRTH